jgi:long-subunit acyl-CoA synthetase (AMP-forming)
MTHPTLDARRQTMDAVGEQPSLCAAFQATAAVHADRPALRTAGAPGAVTWGEYAERVRAVAEGLWALGLRAGEPVGLVLANTPDFHVLDTALMHVGAVPFSVFTGEPVDRIATLLASTGAKVVAVDAAILERVEPALGQSRVEQVILVGGAGDAGDSHITLGALERLQAPDFDFDAQWRRAEPAMIAAIVHTSGTTGTPKAVQLTHGNLVFAAAGTHAIAPVDPDTRTLSYLPNSHLAERFMSHYMGLCFGYEITCVPDPDTLFDTIREVRPTRLFGVPRIWEKVAERARAILAETPELQAVFEDNLERLWAAHRAGEPLEEALDPAALERLAPVREALGLDEARWLGVAAAPSSSEVLATFLALGSPVADLWGLTECLMTTMNPPGAIRLGTVGRPFAGVDVRLSDAGEILVRGPNVFAGYRNQPDKTREILDDDGWIHTGDLGRLDADGYLSIAGRAKEMIINAAGLNISPVTVEHAIKAESSLIEHLAAIGEGRRYLTALVVLSPDELERFAAAHGLSGSYAELTRNPRVTEEIAAAVERGNAKLPRAEQIRGWTILQEPWTTGQELTSLMKLRRAVIEERYADEIEAMYG